MKLTRKLAGAGATVALTLAGLAGTAGPAQAAAYNGACGAGYKGMVWLEWDDHCG